MNGAQSLIETLVAGGVDTCFSNPGTSEMHIVAALDKVTGMRPVLTLFEGVASGAADGYARMAGKPACTLLHLGPGMANGIANFHNAKRARSPMINIVGDHATYHQKLDAPLTSDIASYAKPFSGWYRESASAQAMAQDGADALAAATTAPGQIATLVVPADCAWGDAPGGAVSPQEIAPRARVNEDHLGSIAEALKSSSQAVILMNGAALQEAGLDAADRIASATGAKLFADTFCARTPRGAGRVPISVFPYFPEMAAAEMAEVDTLILVGTKEPVGFFAYPDKPSTFTTGNCRVLTLAELGDDAVTALQDLAAHLAPDTQPNHGALAKPDLLEGTLDADGAARAIAHFMPEGAIVADEGVTSSLLTAIYLSTANPHESLQLTGGAIGMGLPAATGAAIACPDRKTVCLSGDGSAMYTLQALWTQAREELDVTTVIFSNRSYVILNIELDRLGLSDVGEKARSLTNLANPSLNWASLAEGMGVEAFRAETAEDFAKYFSACMSKKGPHLIEAVI